VSDPRSTLPGLNPSQLTVSYGDSILLPSPLIAHSVQIERDEAGNRELIRTTRTLTGQILTSGLGYHYVRQKQRELEAAFSQDHLEFKIVAAIDHPCLVPGTPIESGVFPNVVSIDIREDVQFNRLDYTIVLEDTTAPSGVSGLVQNLSNTWTYAEQDNEVLIEIAHSVSAQGINTSVSGLPSNAIDNAILRVRSLLGLANAPSGFPYYAEPRYGTSANRFYEVTTQREESINLEDATYSVSENFKLVSGLLQFRDERTSQWQRDADGIVTVSLQGTVRGFGRTNDGPDAGSSRTGGGTGFINALSGFNSLVRPQWTTDAIITYGRYGGSGSLAITNPQSISVTQNPGNASIAYAVTYTDNPSENLPSGIQEMSCTVQRTDPVVLNAIIAVPFRALGPVFQRLCSTNEGTYTIQCNVTALNTGGEIVDTNRAIEVAEFEMIRLQPEPADYTALRLTGRQQTIDRINRSIQVSFTWTFAQDIATVPGDEAPVSLGRIS